MKGNICSDDLLSLVMHEKQIDTVLHFAAQTHVDNSFGNSFEFTESNIRGTHVLLEVVKTLGTVKRFLHVSTDEVYGDSSYEKDEANIEGVSLLEPTNPYSATKAGAEMLVMAYGRSYNLPYIITRGNNVYGPHQYPEKAIPKFILLLLKGQQIPIHGDGKATRSYMHVTDAASAFDTILHYGSVHEIYNIAALEERTVLSVAHDIGKMLGKDMEKMVEFVPDRKFNDQRYFIDCSKLIQLGWTQKVTWEQGLRDTIEWYTTNDEESGYWGNISGALKAHPAVHHSKFEGEVYSNVREIIKGDAASRVDVGDLKPPIFLVYGRGGWIGGKLAQFLSEKGHTWSYGLGRIEDRQSVVDDILRSKCSHILNAAGVTGKPNVDWCEENTHETIRANVTGTLNLCDVARTHKVHVTNFSTGCVFTYDDEHVIGGKSFTEEDYPNFTGSFYSETKGFLDVMVRVYSNVLHCRLRMPIDVDLQNPRNFITKIANYDKVINIPNSVTVLDELLPMAIDGAVRRLRGVYNWTNPGAISHNEVLELYKEYLHPELSWQNFTEDEQARVIKVPRSNASLCDQKLKAEFPNVLSVKESIIKHVLEPNKRDGNRVHIARLA